jgi:hypothetical protein
MVVDRMTGRESDEKPGKGIAGSRSMDAPKSGVWADVGFENDRTCPASSTGRHHADGYLIVSISGAF